MPDNPPQLVKATFKALPNGDEFAVKFNPVSLVYSIENSVAQQSGAPKKVQYVAQFSAKLTMDLQFDTTDTGDSVRLLTSQVAQFMQASGNASAKAANSAPQSADGSPQGPPPKAPPVLMFQWGAYQFQGIMDSFKETIDFFSIEGVPLRSLVSVGLSRQDVVFGATLGDLLSSTDTGSTVSSALSDSALSLATRGGDPGAARQLGSDNGLESLRFTGGAQMQVGAGVQLNPPAAFATSSSSGAGAGLSIGISAGGSAGGSAGLSLGVSAGVSTGASAGVSASLSAGISASAGTQTSGLAPAFGASASAGVSATAGAFAGLQTGRAQISSTANLNPLQMMPATVGTDVAAYSGASFSLGGAANSTGSSGLSSDVGTRFNFSDRLVFSSDD
jgi:hypothetical protein